MKSYFAKNIPLKSCGFSTDKQAMVFTNPPKKPIYKRTNVQGFSLVEVLVSIGIVSILIYGLTSMISSQHKGIRSLQESLAKLNLEPTIIRTLSSGGVCAFVLEDVSQSPTAASPNRSTNTINATNASTLAASTVSIQRLPSSASASGSIPVAQVGDSASANSDSVKILTMNFKNFRPNGIDQYLADFEIAFDPEKTLIPLKPIVIKNLSISTKTTDPANAKSFENCAAPRGPAPMLRRYTFTSSGSWTVPEGVSSAFVSMAGGGSSGMGWRISNVIKSGDSGGYVTSYPVNLVPGETITITVGVGGVAYAPESTGIFSNAGSPHVIYRRPASGDDGLGGYPGTSSKIESPTLGLILECAGGSGGAPPGGIDNYGGNTVVGNGTTGLPGATYGSGSPTLPAPNRVASGIYAEPDRPGKCGSGGASISNGNSGILFYSATGLLNSGQWPGGRTPLSLGSGGDIAVSGCYISPTTTGTCISPSPGLNGVVHIDVLY